MVNSINYAAGVSDQLPDRRQDRKGEGGYPPHNPARQDPAKAGAPAADSDLRLVIERDEAGAYYIYKLIDRSTGEVVSELPCEEVARLAKGEDYTAGSVIRTRA